MQDEIEHFVCKILAQLFKIYSRRFNMKTIKKKKKSKKSYILQVKGTYIDLFHQASVVHSRLISLFGREISIKLQCLPMSPTSNELNFIKSMEEAQKLSAGGLLDVVEELATLAE